MHKGTEVLRVASKESMAIQRELEELAAEQAAYEQQLAASAEYTQSVRKSKALRTVDRAAARAVRRLNRNDGAGWKAHGQLLTVCYHYGPHQSFWCLLHRRTIAVVQIPDMNRSYYKRYNRPVDMHFYVGADGRVYRDGLDKVYLAELHERDWAREILAVALKINRICP